MKKELLFILGLGIVLTACKKDQIQKKQDPVQATPEQIAAISTKLSGTWGYVMGRVDFKNVSGLPSNTDYPINGSAYFDGKSQLTVIDYNSKQTQQPYSLSGVDGAFYINVNNPATLERKCKIILLTADSLKFQNTITGKDTSQSLIFTETYVKADESDVANKNFKVTISPFPYRNYFYPLNVNIKIYLTTKGSSEHLADNKDGVTQTYSYSYTPSSGDHIRVVLSGGPGTFGNGPIVQCLATYKGVPYGNDWLSSGLSSALNKDWDIN